MEKAKAGRDKLSGTAAAGYIADMLRGLSDMARRAGLHDLAALIRLAELQAREDHAAPPSLGS